MYVCMYVCMYVLYAYIHVCMNLCIYACMYICMHECIHVCIYIIFKLGFERYGGIVLVGRGIVRGNCPGGKCPFPHNKTYFTRSSPVSLSLPPHLSLATDSFL